MFRECDARARVEKEREDVLDRNGPQQALFSLTQFDDGQYREDGAVEQRDQRTRMKIVRKERCDDPAMQSNEAEAPSLRAGCEMPDEIHDRR